MSRRALREVAEDHVQNDGGFAGEVAFAEVEDAALGGAAECVHNEPADGAGVAAEQVACVYCVVQDLDEAGVGIAEEARGLFAMAGFAAHGEDHVVHVAAGVPEVQARVNPGFDAVTGGFRFGDALVGEFGELVYGVLQGGVVDGVLGLEVEVKGAFGDVGLDGDVFRAGLMETLTREDFKGGLNDFGTAEAGENLLARGGADGFFRSRRSRRSSHYAQS